MVGGQESDARAFLAVRLTELDEAAGRPGLDALAARVMNRRLPGVGWRVTGKRISDWKRGRHVPGSGDALAAVVRELITLARRRVSPGSVAAGLYDEQQWRQWWERARDTRVPAADSEGDCPGKPVSWA